LEIATQADNVERVIEAIKNAAYTGKIGDGKIFVYDLTQVVRIRTGEMDSEAI
jgi:nitrogen regulatory protein P-II 2